MTIRGTPPLSLSDVMAELRTANPGRAYPIAVGDSDVRALAGIASGPIDLGNLYGKTAGVVTPPPPTPSPLTVQTQDGSGYATSTNTGGTVSCQVSAAVSGGTGTITHLWEFVSNPGQFTLSNSNSATARVSRTYTRYSSGAADAELRYTARDSAGAVVVAQPVIANLEWNSGDQFA